MPQISLTDFVDIVSASGTPKATKVKQIKYRPAYNPASDFYRRIREYIVEAHRDDLSIRHVDRALSVLTDKKKETAYPPIVAGYKRWWGRKTLEWFEPPRDFYSKRGIDVSVNPELGLEIDGKPHLVKLYFKNDKLAKNRIDIITHLMAVVLSNRCPLPEETSMSILDVRRAKLFSPTVPIQELDAILNAELAYVAHLWRAI